MANVYFSNRNTNFPRDGDWSYVPNWYSNSARTILLNRLPLANDTVEFSYAITSNVGTFAGNVLGGDYGSVIADPNAVWTGNVSAAFFAAGTFLGGVSGPNNRNVCTIRGGTYTTTCKINAGSISFSNNIVSYTAANGLYTQYGTFSQPVFQVPNTIKAGELFFNTNYTYPENLKFQTNGFYINTNQDGDDSGNPTGNWNETPVFMGDISTSNTGARYYNFFGGNFVGSPTIYAGNNTVYCLGLGFAANMSNDIVATMDYGGYINIWNPQDYNTRTITSNIQIIGRGANTFQRYYSSFDGTPYFCKMIHAPKANIPLIMGANGSYTLDSTKWPKNVFRFGEPEPYAPYITQPYAPGEYTPSVNLTNLPVTTTNLGAILNEY